VSIIISDEPPFAHLWYGELTGTSSEIVYAMLAAVTEPLSSYGPFGAGLYPA